MQIPLIVAILSASVAVMGWLISQMFDLRAEHKKQSQAARLAFVGYSQLTVVPCLVNGFTPRVGRRW